MPTFYFHLTDGRSVVMDRIGLEFPTLEYAKDAAQTALSRHALEAVANGQTFPEHTTIEICDENGKVLDLEWCWCLVREPKPFEVSSNLTE